MDWQNMHLIAPLKHSVLYFGKIGEPGDKANVSSTVCIQLSSSKPTNVWTYMIYRIPSIISMLPFRYSILILVKLPLCRAH